MGAVVREAHGTPSSRRVNSFLVVDGQQRLTTFQIYLAAARDYAQCAGVENSVKDIECYMFNDMSNRMEDSDVEKYKVWPTEYDRELFTDILTAGREALHQKYREHFYKTRDQVYQRNGTPNLLGAYGYFFDCIKGAVEGEDLDDDLSETIGTAEDDQLALAADTGKAGEYMKRRLDALWEVLVEEFKVVEITLEPDDDAQIIFETLNERSEPLLAADLVRNYIFLRAEGEQLRRTATERENVSNLFNKYWKNFEESFWSAKETQGRYNLARTEFFLSNFIAGKTANEVKLSKLYSEYKDFINKPKVRYPSVESELQDLWAYGAHYRRLLERKADDPLGNFANLLHPWDVTTVYPLVLRLWSEEAMDEDEKKQCLPILLTFIVRRAVCGLTTKNYNKFFLSVLKHLESRGFSRRNLVEILTKQGSDSARLPNDTELEKSWLFSHIYQKILTPSRVRAVLEAIECKKRQRFQEIDQLADNLTVEHILPQNWNEHWPLANGECPSSEEHEQAVHIEEENDTRIGQIVRRNRLLNTFGNLTILTKPLNSHISNGPYKQKKTALDEHSVLILNREITRNEEWNEDRIEVRGKELFDVAQDLWPYPKL